MNRAWAGAALVAAGWLVAGVGAGRSSFPVVVAVVLAGAVLVAAGVFMAWRAFIRSRYVITPVQIRRWAALTGVAAWIVVSALAVGAAVVWWLWLGQAVLSLVAAVSLGFQLLLLIGDSHGLTFWNRRSLGFTRVPWPDVERVVFCDGARPNTIEIGVALRPGAELRRSSTRRYDVLTELPCRVVVPRASFDVAGLQQQLAGHPGIPLVERSGVLERVWAPAGRARP